LWFLALITLFNEELFNLLGFIKSGKSQICIRYKTIKMIKDKERYGCKTSLKIKDLANKQ